MLTNEIRMIKLKKKSKNVNEMLKQENKENAKD